MALLISNLHVSIADKEILHGVDLAIKPGEIHAVMGPNGSGKSTLAYTLAGHPQYTINLGEMSLDGKRLNEMSPDERSTAGLFLAFQYPVEVAGVRVNNFLRVAYEERFKNEPARKFPTVLAFRKHLESLADELGVKKDLLSRGLNEGFSGGEKKRLEILQMAVLEPKYALMDETDSGLDVDAISAVADGARKIVEKHKTGVLVITHYQRILKFLQPDFVHVMVNGKIIKSGGRDLAEELEKKGYKDLQ
ncbi:MAG TPA: Fe-S cluster assembly ATPase SufC [Patescibacteria group bacterium]|nr:Fe-S cluster assembly ATPase SufC [Patescibacteria group bacterium]